MGLKEDDDAGMDQGILIILADWIDQETALCTNRMEPKMNMLFWNKKAKRQHRPNKGPNQHRSWQSPGGHTRQPATIQQNIAHKASGPHDSDRHIALMLLKPGSLELLRDIDN
jgi:hypothetical protein